MTEHPPSLPDTKALGRIMAILSWILLLTLLVLFFNQWFNIDNMPKHPKIETINGIKQTIIQRNAHNQYLTTGSINGKEVTLLIDTGATHVVVPGDLASALGLKQGDESRAFTAGGTVMIFQTTIAELIIGHLIFHDIKASINPTMAGNQVLIGMSVLRKLSFSQIGDNFILQSEHE